MGGALLDDKLPWYLYVLANDSKRELYIGVVKDRGIPGVALVGARFSVYMRYMRHVSGGTTAIREWRKRHSIELLKTKRYKYQSVASGIAHLLERSPSLLRGFAKGVAQRRGYRVHLTSGT